MRGKRAAARAGRGGDRGVGRERALCEVKLYYTGEAIRGKKAASVRSPLGNLLCKGRSFGMEFDQRRVGERIK